MKCCRLSKRLLFWSFTFCFYQTIAKEVRWFVHAWNSCVIYCNAFQCQTVLLYADSQSSIDADGSRHDFQVLPANGMVETSGPTANASQTSFLDGTADWQGSAIADQEHRSSLSLDLGSSELNFLTSQWDRGIDLNAAFVESPSADCLMVVNLPSVWSKLGRVRKVLQ